MTSTCTLPTLLAVLALTWADEAQAFQYKINSAIPSKNGNVKFEKVGGSYGLTAPEQLVGVYIIAYDANGAVTSTAQGTINAAAGTWSTSLGDASMTSYKIWFRVKYGSNRVVYDYYSATYRWGTGPATRARRAPGGVTILAPRYPAQPQRYASRTR
jgi:hypothetical protein